MKPICGMVVLLALSIAGGCTRAQEAEVREDAQGLGQKVQTAAEGARDAVGDAALVAKVKTALGMRKGIEASDIDVEAKDGVVTLKGDVNSQTQADLAVDVAKGTEGVTSVNSQLNIRVPAAGSTAPR